MPVTRLRVVGGARLGGAVPVSGYKHALTLLVAAAVATGRRAVLRNVPMNTESEVLLAILARMGARTTLRRGTLDLDTSRLRSEPVPAGMSRLIHGSLYLAPALLARFGEVAFSEAGGDRIGPREMAGARPTSQVGAVMERFGASVAGGPGIRASCRRLRGCTIDLLDFSTCPDRLRGPFVSSATKTALLLAAVAGGPTTIRSPLDREVTWELCAFLRACGCAVTRDQGGWRVEPGGGDGPVEHHLVSDSTEIVTLLACAVHLDAPLLLTGVTAERTRPAIAGELSRLQEMGVEVSWEAGGLTARRGPRLRPLTIEIDSNGFSTDSHPIFALTLLGACGESRITDHVWTNRFSYVGLLTAMGGRARVSGNTVLLRPSVLHRPGVPLAPADSRAAAVALVAALGVEGPTTIVDHGHLDRAHERLAGKLQAVGARIERVDDRKR